MCFYVVVVMMMGISFGILETISVLFLSRGTPALPTAIRPPRGRAAVPRSPHTAAAALLIGVPGERRGAAAEFHYKLP